jgi:hypothetical protein
MNPRHAAALALVGWYLMVPPMTGSADRDRVVRHPIVEMTAPLSEWETEGSYDSAKECRGAIQDNLQFIAHRHFETVDEQNAANTQSQLGQCVATDDPRLKEK